MPAIDGSIADYKEAAALFAIQLDLSGKKSIFLHHQFAPPFDAPGVVTALESILRSFPTDLRFAPAGGSEKQAEPFPLWRKLEWSILT